MRRCWPSRGGEVIAAAGGAADGDRQARGSGWSPTEEATIGGTDAARDAAEAAERRPARGPPRPLDRLLLDRHRRLARRRASCARSSPPATSASRARCRRSRSPSRSRTWSAACSPTRRSRRRSSRSSPSSSRSGNKREAFRLASTLIFMVALILGALTALFILLAPVVCPSSRPATRASCSTSRSSLSQLLFPILVLLGMTGMVVGVLNSYDRFGAFAISPLFWNIAIIAVLVGLAPGLPRGRRDLRLRDRRSSSAPSSSSRSRPSTCATRRSGSRRVVRLAHDRPCGASCC